MKNNLEKLYKIKQKLKYQTKYEKLYFNLNNY